MQKKVGQVYTPSDWCELIKKSNQKTPFKVTMMTQSDFYSFENLSDFFKKKLKTDDGLPVDFRNVRCFKFTSDKPNVIYVKHALSGNFKSITVSQIGLTSSVIVPSLHELILQKYDESITLDANKVKDLRKLLPFIPEQHWSFYNDIFANNQNTMEEDPLNGTLNYVENI